MPTLKFEAASPKCRVSDLPHPAQNLKSQASASNSPAPNRNPESSSCKHHISHFAPVHTPIGWQRADPKAQSSDHIPRISLLPPTIPVVQPQGHRSPIPSLRPPALDTTHTYPHTHTFESHVSSIEPQVSIFFSTLKFQVTHLNAKPPTRKPELGCRERAIRTLNVYESIVELCGSNIEAWALWCKVWGPCAV